jgi:DNA modification methylase
MEINKIYQGNNLDILKTFEDNSIDSIVTDPPYGLGKEPNAVDVLSSWITTGYHEVKGKGFMGKKWDSFVPQPIFWKECYRVLKPGGHLLSFAGTRTYDWMVMGLRLSGFEIRDMIAWLYGSGFPKSHDVSKAIDKMMGAEREVVGINPNAIGRKENKGKFQPKVDDDEIELDRQSNITAPSTNQAKQWQGWGTALKPALEPIVMARKPLDGTVAENVLKWGVGGINIDGCRIDYGNETDNRVGTDFVSNNGDASNNQNDNQVPNKRYVQMYKSNGRFPANVIHDGSDEVVSLFPETTSGQLNSGHKRGDGTGNSFTGGGGTITGNYGGDSGSASRFFYTAKASQNERNFGLGEFDDSVTTDGRIKPIDNAFNRGETTRKNIHPTVKPIDLMRYLVRLVTPKGGICLDPFLGSGTTAVACKSEKIDYIGIELEAEYVKIAEARIKAETVQYNIFDFLDEE